MDPQLHEHEPELRQLAEDAVTEHKKDPNGDRAGMLLDAYSAAAERRDAELTAYLERLRLDDQLVRLEVAEAAGLDVRSAVEPHLPAAVATLRDLAKNAPDGEARRAAREALEARGFTLEDDEDQ